jgi:hypothetical protein
MGHPDAAKRVCPFVNHYDSSHTATALVRAGQNRMRYGTMTACQLAIASIIPVH